MTQKRRQKGSQSQIKCTFQLHIFGLLPINAKTSADASERNNITLRPYNLAKLIKYFISKQ